MSQSLRAVQAFRSAIKRAVARSISDFEPKGAVSRQYGAYDDAAGVSKRALYVLDSNGKVFWSHLSPMAINPGADGILDALDRLGAR